MLEFTRTISDVLMLIFVERLRFSVSRYPMTAFSVVVLTLRYCVRVGVGDPDIRTRHHGSALGGCACPLCFHHHEPR